MANNSGGVQNMDYKMVKAFTDAFTKFKSQKTESRKRKPMKLTESQTRRAIRKWLFEYTTDSGVSHRMSTDDKIAGKLGDDREDQPASMIPDEIPIMAMSQMATQLSHEMPPIEDAEFVPGTVEELGRASNQISQEVPSSEISWFYGKIKELADEAVEKGNKVNILDEFEPDEVLSKQIRPAQKASEESTNEAWNRWSEMLQKTLFESRYNRPGKMTTRMKNKKLTPQDMRLSYSPEDDSFEVSQADLEDMADEFGEEDLSSLPGFDPSRHSRTRTDADVATGNVDGEVKLRELVSLGIYPKVRTMSGMRKKIKATIDPLVQMTVTAGPAVDWLSKWYDGDHSISWNGKQVSGPDVYAMAIEAYEKAFKKDQAAKDRLADAIESETDFYTEAMAEIVMAPIVKRWIREVEAGTIDVSSSKKKNNFQMSQWITEEVLDSGFGKSRAPRRAKKLISAMGQMEDFKAAMTAAISNQEMADLESSEEEG